MLPLEARFDAKVDRSGEHHLWTGAHDADGIGQIRVDGKLTTARRVAWELAHGPLPPNRRLSGCPDEPRCVRVEHLSLAGQTGPAVPRHSTRGRGSKREIRPGVWKLTVAAGRNESGNYRRVSRTIHGTQAQATRALQRFAAEVRGPVNPVTSTPPWTLTELVARYLGHLEHTGRRPETIRRYRGLLSAWIGPALGTVAPSDVTPSDVDQLLAQMHGAGQSDSSVHQARTLLRSAYPLRPRYVLDPPQPCPGRPAMTCVCRSERYIHRVKRPLGGLNRVSDVFCWSLS
jgi:hypothetical protein